MKSKRNTPRLDSGFSLVTMLTLSLIATLVISGLLASLLPVYKTVTGDVAKFQVRNFAEASLDFVLAKLNDPDYRESVAPSDDIGSPSKSISVTSKELNLPGDMSALVTVANDMPSENSKLFNPSLAPYSYIQEKDGSVTKINQKWSYLANGETNKNFAWRRLTSVVSYGMLKETITVAAMIDYSVTRVAPTSTNAMPFFNYGGLGTQTVNVTNSAKTYGYSGPSETLTKDTTGEYDLGGDIAAYYQANFDGTNNVIGGSLDVPSIKDQKNISAQTDGGTQVNRYLTVNETAPGFTPSDALGKFDTGDFKVSERNAMLTGQTNPQTSIPPAPDLPRNAEGAVNAIPDGNLNLSEGNQTMTDNHLVSNMSTTTSTNITASNTAIYVQNDGSSNQVMTLNGNINATTNSTVQTSPSNFQVWYNGTGKIVVHPKDMRATIFAPNAEVEISSTGVAGSFRGAVVARTLNLSNVKFFYDRSLKTAPGLSYDPSKIIPGNQSKFKIVSYKEILTQR